MKELLKRKGLRIALLAVALLVAAGVVGINVQSAQRDKEYNRHMDAAEKYLSDLDYEQAIAEYTLAWEIEPKDEVLAALEETYLAYAETYVEAGDYERAAAILQEGYELTGRESLKDRLDEVESLLEREKEEEDLEAQQDEGALTDPSIIDFPFTLGEITIKGYPLYGDHYDAVCEAFGCPAPSLGNGYIDDGEGGLSLQLDNEYGHISSWVQGNGDKQLGILNPSGSQIGYQLHPTGQHTLVLTFLEDLGPYGVNIPISPQASYEEWCRVMQVQEIKEKGEEESWEGGQSWYFQTRWGRGSYSEFDEGRRQSLTIDTNEVEGTPSFTRVLYDRSELDQGVVLSFSTWE